MDEAQPESATKKLEENAVLLLFKQILENQGNITKALGDLQTKVSAIVGRDNCATHRKDIYDRLAGVERVCIGYEEIKSSMARTEDIKNAISEATKGLASKDDLTELSKHFDSTIKTITDNHNILKDEVSKMDSRLEKVEITKDNILKFIKNNKVLTGLTIIVILTFAEVTLGRVHDSSLVALIKLIASIIKG
jgi:hypothetical protein